MRSTLSLNFSTLSLRPYSPSYPSNILFLSLSLSPLHLCAFFFLRKTSLWCQYPDFCSLLTWEDRRKIESDHQRNHHVRIKAIFYSSFSRSPSFFLSFLFFSLSRLLFQSRILLQTTLSTPPSIFVGYNFLQLLQDQKVGDEDIRETGCGRKREHERNRASERTESERNRALGRTESERNKK